ncbi:hypothetical protein HYH02_005693 [Chlamydomonas schloesseri]|uniref:Uncharacterized protein n=1 Tax=Chlamydomonas schloesseri TaxID=2026947 RepID=A0A835WLF0_9CHLO|nr:hypothetical protein HYH02_005693 [Chlamydomonas schloesseri]|eukprot:KAG2448935.1 hypothetical protein HYH02_005693 [Chlamydomonas schloesseri]
MAVPSSSADFSDEDDDSGSSYYSPVQAPPGLPRLHTATGLSASAPSPAAAAAASPQAASAVAAAGGAAVAPYYPAVAALTVPGGFTPASSLGGAPTATGAVPGTPKAGSWSPALVVFSGGTAFNSVAGHLRHLTTRVAHVLPVSDDGGSTAEIVRVLGGPAVGDIRSRCLRLADDSDEEARAVKRLLAHRLPAYDAGAAKQEWYAIVEGDHALWRGVSDPYKHTIRAFLVQFHTAILSHNSGERFSFRNGSVGNFFFAGARIFFRSLEAAIFLFARVARLPEGSHVLPAIATEQRITLGAELEDGSVLRGQNQISHPPPPDDGGGPQEVDKGCDQPLPAPIRRVFYMAADEHRGGGGGGGGGGGAGGGGGGGGGGARRGSAGGAALSGGGGGGGAAAEGPALQGIQGEHEVFPAANPRVLQDIARADALIYGMGSLYTSICPTLCLEGMGEAIASRPVPKVMMLNGSHDRETACCGAHDGPMTAADMVQAVCDALNRRRTRRPCGRLRHPPGAYVTGLLVPRGGAIRVDPQALALLGVRHILEVDSYTDDCGRANFDPAALVAKVDEILRLHWDTAALAAAAAAGATPSAPASAAATSIDAGALPAAAAAGGTGGVAGGSPLAGSPSAAAAAATTAAAADRSSRTGMGGSSGGHAAAAEVEAATAGVGQLGLLGSGEGRGAAGAGAFGSAAGAALAHAALGNGAGGAEAGAGSDVSNSGGRH